MEPQSQKQGVGEEVAVTEDRGSTYRGESDRGGGGGALGVTHTESRDVEGQRLAPGF